MKNVKNFFRKSLFHNKVAMQILNKYFNIRYPASEMYWEKRYLKNGTSGNGSYGNIALYKAGIINKFVAENNIRKIIEFGCGDGNQLKQFEFPLYIGFDVSVTAIEKCISIFKGDNSKSFFIYNHKAFVDNIGLFKAELVISLDVIYHLLTDEEYENYMYLLFSSSLRFVIIYAWDVEGKQKLHVRHRKFTEWIKKNLNSWQLINQIKNEDGPTCDFFIYEKKHSSV